jgi:CHAT domain-containing protein/Tfp pilus assembly protein PilF
LTCAGCKLARTPQLTYEDARLKLRQGQLPSALEEADRACRRYSSEQSEWHWRFKVLKAEILARQGLFNESLELLRAEPPASLGTADLAVRRSLVEGVASAFLRRPKDAAEFLARAQELARAHHPDLLAEVALAQGASDFLAGDLQGAATAYRDSLQRAREQKDLYVEANALAGLGVVATKEEHYGEFIEWSQAALQLAESVGAQKSLVMILGNMAWGYLRLGDLESALAFFNRAVEVSAHSGFSDQQAYWSAGTSQVYYLQHNYEAAEAVLLRALDLARSQGNKRTLTVYMNSLSETELQLGRTASAKKYYQEAIQLEQDSPDPAERLTSELIRGNIDAEERDYAHGEKTFREVIEDPKADSSQRWEAEAGLARIYARTGQNAKAETEFRRCVSLVEAVRSSVEPEDLRLSFLSSAITFYDDYIDFLVSQHRLEDALQVAELSRARTLEEGLSGKVEAASSSARGVRPQQIAQKLKTTLLFYWIGHNHSYLWVITPSKTPYFELPKASEIEPVVKSYWKTLAAMRDAQDSGRVEGEKLYAVLVEPAKRWIPLGSRVMVLPAESLYGLNFETLIVPNPQPHYWIEDVTLTTASSLTLLERSAARRETEEKSLFLVGNTEQPNAEFPLLPQAPAEMEKIAHYFPDSRRKVLEGKQATPSAYLNSNPERYSYLHFVTHGTASQTRPLESAVILTKEGDSYKLYARDIVTHPLKAQLVTISACNGAGTRAYAGEGLVGLSWAFLRAGAHNVIASLWEVSDASTPQLMGELYKGLSADQDPASALRAAKLTLLHSDSVFRKPFYWAPFQLYTGS